MPFDKETSYPADIYPESEMQFDNTLTYKLDFEENQNENYNQQSSSLNSLRTDLEMLTKLFTAFTLLGEVLAHDSGFTVELLPACTEKFLQQANYKLNQLQYKIQYQAEQSNVS